MIALQTVAVFILASTALSLSPGPDNIFVLTQSAIKGRRAGILVTLGLCTGLLVHTAMVSLGIAAIFQTSAVAFNTLKTIGSIYLVYLAWQAFKASASSICTEEDQLTHWRQLYLRGILMNVTNPKVAIFFLAFLPQFVDPSSGSIPLQMLTLGALFIISALFVFCSIACCAGFLGKWLQGSKKSQQVINRIASTVFVGLALKLLLTER